MSNVALEHDYGIGWGGASLGGMLEESERIFAETGHYGGLDELPLKAAEPIRYEKMFSRLRGGLVGARETAMNISASPIVREVGELCFALYTPEGDAITLSTGIMAHVHTMSMAIKHMIRSDYETNPGIAPGDIFVNNDPQLGGVHNADVMNFLPLFHEGEIVGWAAGVVHELDVGAPQPASMPIGTVSRYEDGLILSCMKVGSNDTLNRDYENRIETAVRMPFYWVLDEKCRIAGCQIIRATVERLIAEEGIDTYKLFMREVIEDARRAFKRNLTQMTVPGIYRVPSFMDVPHEEDKGLMPDYAAVNSMMNCPLSLTIGRDASFHVDLDGANKWGYHSFNCTPSGLQGGLWVVLSQTLVPNDKVNDGAYLATSFNTPYGTWSNPDNRSVSNTLSWIFLIPCFTGLIHALSRAFTARGYLEEVLAAYPFTGNITQGGGINHHGLDAGWSNFEHSSCGISARWGYDGEVSGAAMWNPEGDMGDVEAWELTEPLLYFGRRIRPNTGGPGKQRGGSGWECVRMLYGTERQILFHCNSGHVFQTSGLYGGYPGSSGYRHMITNTDMKERIAEGLPYPVEDRDTEDSQIVANVEADHLIDRRCHHFPVSQSEYDLYLSVLNGGHGLGDPLDRDPEAVVADLNSGDVLPRFAPTTYGVVAEQDADGHWTLDRSATDALRADMRKQRLANSVPVEEWMEGQRGRAADLDFIEPVAKAYRESIALSENWAALYKDFWGLSADWTPPNGDATGRDR